MTRGLTLAGGVRKFPRCLDCGKTFTMCGGRVADGPIHKLYFPDPDNAPGRPRLPDRYRYVTPPWVCGKRRAT